MISTIFSAKDVFFHVAFFHNQPPSVLGKGHKKSTVTDTVTQTSVVDLFITMEQGSALISKEDAYGHSKQQYSLYPSSYVHFVCHNCP